VVNALQHVVLGIEYETEGAVLARTLPQKIRALVAPRRLRHAPTPAGA